VVTPITHFSFQVISPFKSPPVITGNSFSMNNKLPVLIATAILFVDKQTEGHRPSHHLPF